MDESQELNEELDDGRQWAVALVEHLKRMGANCLVIPVVSQGWRYDVQVIQAGCVDDVGVEPTPLPPPQS